MFSPAELLILAVIFILVVATRSPRSMRSFGLTVRHIFTGRRPEKPASASDLELCYRMLGVSPSTPWSEIEKAYRTKAKVHHPDRGGDEDAMRALNEAFSLLKKARGGRRS